LLYGRRPTPFLSSAAVVAAGAAVVLLVLLLLLQAPDAEYEGPTAIAAVKQPETTYSKLLKELHDRWVTGLSAEEVSQVVVQMNREVGLTCRVRKGPQLQQLSWMSRV
jgi:hypothetical protein